MSAIDDGKSVLGALKVDVSNSRDVDIICSLFSSSRCSDVDRPAPLIELELVTFAMRYHRRLSAFETIGRRWHKIWSQI